MAGSASADLLRDMSLPGAGFLAGCRRLWPPGRRAWVRRANNGVLVYTVRWSIHIWQVEQCGFWRWI